MIDQRGARLPFYLALAYVFLVLYASLSPFSGWRNQGFSAFAFLSVPWSRYFTWFDVIANFLAYIPLGFLLVAAWQAKAPRKMAVFYAAIAVVALSFTMEALQTYLPVRISSNLDLLCNSLGGIVGAVLAGIAGSRLTAGSHLVTLRYDWFIAGYAADFALVTIGLWLVSQFSPAVPLFGSGDLHGLFQADAVLHNPRWLALAEALVAALNLLGVCLLFSAVLRHRSAAAVIGLIAVALLLKASSSAVLGETQSAWMWLTPGTAAGLLAGTTLLLPLMRLTLSWRVYVALAMLAGAVVVINLMPENPYYPDYLQEFNLQQGRYMNFNKLTRGLAEWWPFLAAGCLLALLRNTRDAS